MKDGDNCPKCEGHVYLGIESGYFVCLNCGYEKVIENSDESDDE